MFGEAACHQVSCIGRDGRMCDGMRTFRYSLDGSRDRSRRRIDRSYRITSDQFATSLCVLKFSRSGSNQSRS